jgi:potassium efflux system protein
MRGEFLRLIFATLLLLGFGTAATAQVETPVAVEPMDTIEQLETKLKSLSSSADLEEASKQQRIDFLTRAIEALRREQDFQTRLQQLKESADGATERLKNLQEQLTETGVDPQSPPVDIDLTVAQQRLADHESHLVESEKRLESLKAELNRRSMRRSEIPQRQGEVRIALEKVESQLKDAAGGETRPTDGSLVLLKARRRALQAEIGFLGQEIPAYNTTGPVLLAERDVASRDLVRSQKTVSVWRELVADLRRSEAEKFQRQAERRIDTVHPTVKPLAIEVSKLASRLVSERKAISTQIKTLETGVRGLEAQRKQLKREYDELTARAEAVGFTNSVGLLLRKQRRALPDTAQLRRNLSDRQELIGETHVKRITYQHERPVADQLEIEVEKFLSANRSSQPSERQRVESDLRQVLADRSQYLDGVISDLGSAIDKLTFLDGEERLLLAQTEEQSAYIAAHILWVRGSTPVNLKTPREAWTAWEWTTRSVMSAAGSLASDAKAHPLIWGIAALLFAGFISFRMQHRNEMGELADVASRGNTTSMWPTLKATALTALYASIGPLILVFLAWRISASSPAPGSHRAIAGALRNTAGLWFLFDGLRRLCRPTGLARAHFQWPERSIDSVRAMTRSAMVLCVPLAFLVVVTERSGNDLYYSSLGRLALVVALLGFGWRQYRLLRPSGRVVTELHATSPNGWLSRLRYVYVLSVLIPLALSGLALAGYLFAAHQLSARFVHTVWVITGTIVTIALLRRWQLLTYRSLAMQQARDRRAALLKEAEKEGNVAEVEVTTAAFEEEAVVLSDSNQQTRKLIGWLCSAVAVACVAWLWSDVLPALSSFYEFKLWKNSLADSAAPELDHWVKLGDLGISLVVVALTIICASNVPGVLEFAVLQRLPFDAGSRYAISNIFRYVLVVIGLVVAFRFLGIGWSNVQWLVAAMTVGLGFGLQEVFANFVSGLILLFERPVRVGDTITVGDITGTVTRIRIRATTIVDWDRKELVVPNREFVTGQLINWTLTDATLRVVMKVGIAYGSDTELATKLLYQIAGENDDVLNDPPAIVVFQEFGDSTLNFQLRFFVDSLSKFVTIRHSMNMAIDAAFRKHNIEIAFPQRDLHIRSSDTPFVVQARDAFVGDTAN